jgi:hypothetical protein
VNYKAMPVVSGSFGSVCKLSKSRGCNSSIPRSASVSVSGASECVIERGVCGCDIGVRDLGEGEDGVLSWGGGAGGSSGVVGETGHGGRTIENLEALAEKKDPIPAPQAPKAAFVSIAVTLSGLAISGSFPNFFSSEGGESVFAGDGKGLSCMSASDFVISTGVLDLETSTSEAELELGGVRWAAAVHRPRTPSTALKKFVEPTEMVLDIASRVGASCCSNLSSWMPSCRRSVMSVTTETFSLHGWLQW